jgi:hypothetical protein
MKRKEQVHEQIDAIWIITMLYLLNQSNWHLKATVVTQVNSHQI